MPELDERTQNRLRDLCNQITVAHELDPEIQEELRGHMEDKLRAYLSGEELLTEDDAFVLVREHFGDPAVLKSLLRDAHPREARLSFARRIAGAFLVLAVLVMIERLLFVVLGSVAASVNQRSALAYRFAIFAVACAASVTPFFIFAWWQRRIAAGRAVWLQRSRPRVIIELLTLVILVCLVTPTLGSTEVFTFGFPAQYGKVPRADTYTLEAVRLLTVAQCLAWLWWCNRGHSSLKAMFWGLSSWLVWATISAPINAGATRLSFFGGIPATLPGEVCRGDIGAIDGVAISWAVCFRYSLRQFRSMCNPGSWALHVAMYTVIAYCLYSVGRWTIQGYKSSRSTGS